METCCHQAGYGTVVRTQDRLVTGQGEINNLLSCVSCPGTNGPDTGWSRLMVLHICEYLNCFTSVR